MTSDRLPEGFVELGEQGGKDAERADRARRLLDELGRRAACAQETRVRKVRALLDHSVVRDDLARRRVRRQLTAERFNVFEALWIDRREIYHSRILAYLLDPRQSHDQGTVFLIAFLQAVSRKMPGGESVEWVGSLDCGACRVTAEHHAEEAGRIDLVIEFPCGTRIAIENKVDHFEGDRQLPRYREWLDKRSVKRGQQVLVFLTPDGRNSVDDCGEYVRLSYRDLADALAAASGECASTAVPLLSTLQQYIQLCRRLAERGDEVAAPSKEILEVLRDPTALAVALDLEPHILAIKDEVKRMFRRRVFEFLATRLGDDTIWTADRKRPWDEYVCIRAKSDQGWGHTSSNYSCGVDLLFDRVEGGWHRPANIDLKNRPADNDSINIETRMVREGLGTPSVTWVCLTNQIDGIPHLVWSDPDDIVAIHRDNLGEGDLDLAERVANWIWDRFDRYRGEIEQLESFKQAAGQRE